MPPWASRGLACEVGLCYLSFIVGPQLHGGGLGPCLDCSIHWVGEDGKRYCFGTEAAKAEFLKDPKGNLEKARTFRGGEGAP